MSALNRNRSKLTVREERSLRMPYLVRVFATLPETLNSTTFTFLSDECMVIPSASICGRKMARTELLTLTSGILDQLIQADQARQVDDLH